MNNRFDRYVKKFQKRAVLAIIGFMLFILLLIVNRNNTFFYILLLSITVVLIIMVIVGSNAERKKMMLYKMVLNDNRNLNYPLLYKKEYLDNLTGTLNDKIELSEDISSLVDYIQWMINNKEFVFFEQDFKLDEIVNLLNNLLKSKNIDYRIDVNEILQNDTEMRKEQRKNDINNDFQDLAAIRFDLERNGLELIRFYAPLEEGFANFVNSGHVLTIIRMDQIEQMDKIELRHMQNK